MCELSQMKESYTVVHHVTWTIPNLLKVVDETIVGGVYDPSLQSGVIKFPSSKCEWKLSFYAKHASNVNNIAFSLSREKIDPKIDKAKVKISLVSLNGKTKYSSNDTDWFQVQTNQLRLERKTYLPDDTLTVKCDFEILILRKYTKSDFESESKSERKRSLFTSLTLKINKLAALYDNQICSDVTLRCDDGSEFKAHKAILAAQSPVFSNMFKHDMLENRTNLVNIPDIQAQVVRELLHHIYGKCSDNLPPDIYLQLYAAANKYQLLELKLDCGLEMVKHLNSDNVCEVAVLAYVCDDPDLFSAAKLFLLQNVLKSHLLVSDTWIDFVKNSPEIATRLVTF